MRSLPPTPLLGNPDDEQPISRLLPVTPTHIGQEEVNAVDGRSLHAFLEVGKDFSAWMPEQIEAFGFLEHQDFEVFSRSGENLKGGRPKKEYLLSIPMAKELAMVQRTAKGKQARLYFIECERRAQNPMAFLNDPQSLRGALLTYTEKVLVLEEKVGALTPKAEALDRIATRGEGSMCPTDAAKILEVSPKWLFFWLQENKWIYRRPGGSHWLAYQGRLHQGLLEHKVTTVSRGDGTEKVVEQLLITAKGLVRLAEAIGKVIA